jgi:hypothetical protein
MMNGLNVLSGKALKVSKPLYISISILSLLMIVSGVACRIVSFSYGRSLWLDEGFLASSVFTQNIRDILANGLDYRQTAPLGFVYLVKAVCAVFGPSEISLRIVPLLAGFGTIALIVYIGTAFNKNNVFLLFAGFYAVLPFFIRYSNELKPYMLDNFLVLFSLLLFLKYRAGKAKLYQLAAAYAVFLWFSFGALLCIASVMLLICGTKALSLFKREINKADFLKALGLSAIVLISFILNYFVWLKKLSGIVTDRTALLLKFPLLPTTVTDIKTAIYLIKRIFLPLQSIYAKILLPLLSIYGIYSSIRHKDGFLLVPAVIGMVFLTFLASALGLYAAYARTFQYIMVLLIVLSAYGCYHLVRGKQKMLGLFAFIIMLVLSVNEGIGSSSYLTKSGSLLPGQEINANIDYLNNNMTDGDMVYLLRFAIPTFAYKTNYTNGDKKVFESNLDTPYVYKNVIYGIGYQADNDAKSIIDQKFTVNKERLLQSVDAIKAYDSVYLLTQMTTNPKHYLIRPLIEALSAYGTVTVANNYVGTYLYHFVKNK